MSLAIGNLTGGDRKGLKRRANGRLQVLATPEKRRLKDADHVPKRRSPRLQSNIPQDCAYTSERQDRLFLTSPLRSPEIFNKKTLYDPVKLSVKINKEELLDPGKLISIATFESSKFLIELSLIGISSDKNSGPRARTYLKIKVEDTRSPPYSVRIETTAVLSTGKYVSVPEASFDNIDTKEWNFFMLCLATEEELDQMEGNTLTLHYKLTITP